MVDQPQYTGATYNAEMYMLPTETMSEYLARLAKLRAQGILGGGGMLDLKETPTVVTPAAQQPLGKLVVRKDSGDSGSDVTAERVSISPEQRLANAVDVATGRDMNIPAVLGFFGGPIGKGIDALATYDRNKTIDEALSSRAYTDEQKEAILNDRELLNEMLYEGNLTATAPEDTNRYGVDTWNWGTQVSEGLGSLWDSVVGNEAPAPVAIGRTWAANPMPQLPTVIGTPMTRQPTANEMLDGMLMGNGMLSTNADSGDTVYTSSWGDTYDFGSYSPETQAGLSITDSYNDGSFGD